jgi:RimJ/RimL family protein N-acetyltransferase
MAHWEAIRGAPTVMLRTVVSDGQVAGNVVRRVQVEKREVGYWLGCDFWGSGVATRTLALFLEERTERPLYAHLAKNNLGSQRVLEKCGFVLINEESGEVRLLRNRSLNC